MNKTIKNSRYVQKLKMNFQSVHSITELNQIVQVSGAEISDL